MPETKEPLRASRGRPTDTLAGPGQAEALSQVESKDKVMEATVSLHLMPKHIYNCINTG